MTQFKHLAGLLAKAEADSPEERRYAKKLLQWTLANIGELDAEESLLERLMYSCENATADSGCDRCECGCKYWENDLCIDCCTKHAPKKAA